MIKDELKISSKDWLNILIIGILFGFFQSLIFYFLNKDLQTISTIVFSISTAFFIAIFAMVLISSSNRFILPKIDKKYWSIFSLFFSFLSGFFGFLSAFFIYLNTNFEVIALISSFWISIAVVVGFLTLLIALILHQFVFLKNKNSQIAKEIIESKLKSLENELNPHFLFNALNSVSQLIYIDKKKAEDAVLQLSKFLRNAINKESLVTLENEILMVKTYVGIENIRFDNKVILHIDDYKDLKLVKIPKFSIQLLVENGIKHGYLGKELNIYIKFDKNYIKVSNDGKKSSNIKFKTGLSNLENRLKILNIGELEYVEDERNMAFSIILKDKN
ncbi:histidine kinase [Aliarcobacter cryaerophilus ATCC 43158]|uniref:Two-component system sensor histidine kinase, LytS/YehU family n=1 Tax=Aliarcobacter cryaerophilus ATCC 43158 TaxID=1032070 RepID=A0AAD0TTD8_9BACT|nr:histidine kinase [Aliarcobacter cryaerophilus]AYJ80016.1 two-component system sensor histidine kinase, LytS/YehU family [Aliarcobacter cryaerophilus ATCC 43158]PRM97631.1 histidine kinase [Aliarcobacter cryaerophilus]QCZ24243.1 histidine kinase [Aliarcobacter cryaerophilus ATCC 43158]